MTNEAPRAGPRRVIPSTDYLKFVTSSDGWYLWGVEVPHGWDALGAAISRGECDEWLTHGSPVNPERGARPSLLACLAKWAPEDVVSRLLARGASLAPTLEDGSPALPLPLVAAVGRGSVPLVRSLLEHGADLNPRSRALCPPATAKSSTCWWLQARTST